MLAKNVQSNKPRQQKQGDLKSVFLIRRYSKFALNNYDNRCPSSPGAQFASNIRIIYIYIYIYIYI